MAAYLYRDSEHGNNAFVINNNSNYFNKHYSP